MSLETFKFYYYFVFLWGGAGMLFIAIAAVRELISQFKK